MFPPEPAFSTSMMWPGHIVAAFVRPAALASVADLTSHAMSKMLPLGMGSMS